MDPSLRSLDLRAPLVSTWTPRPLTGEVFVGAAMTHRVWEVLPLLHVDGTMDREVGQWWSRRLVLPPLP